MADFYTAPSEDDYDRLNRQIVRVIIFLQMLMF
jgi:hypothetical protein